jgi:hypothetical protein
MEPPKGQLVRNRPAIPDIDSRRDPVEILTEQHEAATKVSSRSATAG